MVASQAIYPTPSYRDARHPDLGAMYRRNSAGRILLHDGYDRIMTAY